MKRACLCLLLIACLVCTGCAFTAKSRTAQLVRGIGKTIGVDLKNAEIVCIRDTHGGFHGDGILAVCLRPDAKTAARLTEQLPNRHWRPLPISDEAHRMLFDWGDPLANSEDFHRIEDHPSGRAYGDFPEDGFPDAQLGCWIFCDKQLGDSDARYTDAHISDDERSSWNFWCAWFDADTRLLYFIEFDT